jgi:aminoglycoside phosphotransferase (APT) family kinase protein
MAAGARRSRRELADGFGAWLSARDGVAVSVEVTRPQSGLSSETVMLEATSVMGVQSLVVRLPPAGEPLFPDYDLERQARVQSALGATAVPVAKPLALETDEKWVGAPFLVMPRIAGRTLTSAPPYPGSGWLHDAKPAVQSQVMTDFATMLGQIHRLDFATLGLGELSGGGPTLHGMLDYWDSYLSWATSDEDAGALYREALKWLRLNVPETASICLLWGDPQLVNLVYDDDFRASAVLDWEMAATGPAEVDLGWFLALHEGACETAGSVLPGDPGRDAFIASYSASLGRDVKNLPWYELFAHVRSGAIVLRIGELMARDGMPNGWTSKVPQLTQVRRLLEEV